MQTAVYDIFKECFEDLYNIVERNLRNPSDLNITTRKIVSETIIFLKDMLDHVELDFVEEKYVENWIYRLTHVLGLDMDLNKLFQIHYFRDNYSRNLHIATQSVISIMVALKALEYTNNGLTDGTTEYKLFKEYIPKFRVNLEIILKSVNLNVNDFFLLLNTIDALSYMSRDFDTELNRFKQILIDLESSFNEACNISPGLLIYATDINNRINLNINLNEIPSIINGKPSVFLALLHLKNNNHPNQNLLTNAKRANTIHLWWIAHVWDKLIDKKDIIGILPFYANINVDNIFELTWGNIDEIRDIPIIQREINDVIKFYDRDVRDTLYNYFINHPNITNYSKANLDQERKKAHTGAEISDFNVELNVGREEMWISMPIKSGAESNGRDPIKMQQHFLYQFIKPMLYFGMHKTVVFPIILIERTLNTHEFLSQIKAHLNLPIFIIDAQLYTQFLKKNSLI